MKITEKRKQKSYSLDAADIDFLGLSRVGSELSKKILKSIVDTEKYPKLIATELSENEQKIYYHIRQLENAGIITVVREGVVHGTPAKYYKVCAPALVVRLKELIPKQEISTTDENVAKFFHPFIVDGKFNAKIIIGSPDPHGPQKARSRDGYYGIDLALFLGTFINHVPELNVRLDTEVNDDDLCDNLILIGGPITNSITGRFNKNLPVFFSSDKNIYSKISKTTYSSDETGIIVKIKNPIDNAKSILIVAGKRYSGTRAGVLAFLKEFKQVYSGNKFNKEIIAKVVEGLDLDSDGIVDSVEFRE